jgi:hypothetical protein
MSLDAVILFFLFGFFLQLLKVDFVFPEGLSKSLMLILLLAIGLKGGVALQQHISLSLLIDCLIIIMMGIITPLIAYPLLRYFGEFDKTNAACMAAHYGSVSVGTFAVAIGYLESQNIPYEEYFVLFVVMLEVPAIIVGLALAKSGSTLPSGEPLKEIFLNPGIILLVGALLIGFLSNESINKTFPLFKELFGGVLALFLLEMGMIAAAQMKKLNDNRAFIAAFGVFMPLVAGMIGALTGHYLMGMSTGGILLVATLSASASYIAVPAAMRVALPQADHGLSIAASLGVTFPFNVLVGIPLYWLLANYIA